MPGESKPRVSLMQPPQPLTTKLPTPDSSGKEVIEYFFKIILLQYKKK